MTCEAIDIKIIFYSHANKTHFQKKDFALRNSEKDYSSLSIVHLHDDVILLLRPESFRVLLSCANLGFRHWNLAGITKFEYERKNEKDSGRSGKMTSSCKWPTKTEKNCLPSSSSLFIILSTFYYYYYYCIITIIIKTEKEEQEECT